MDIDIAFSNAILLGAEENSSIESGVHVFGGLSRLGAFFRSDYDASIERE